MAWWINFQTRIKCYLGYNLLRFLQNYFKYWKITGDTKWFLSDYSSIESGVTQGSVLGPLLFLVLTSSWLLMIACFFHSRESWNVCKWSESRFLRHSSVGASNLTQSSRTPMFYFLVRNLVQTTHRSCLMELLWQKWITKNI